MNTSHTCHHLDLHKEAVKILAQIKRLQEMHDLNIRRANSIRTSWLFGDWAIGYRLDAAKNRAALEVRLAQYAQIIMQIQDAVSPVTATSNRLISAN